MFLVVVALVTLQMVLIQRRLKEGMEALVRSGAIIQPIMEGVVVDLQLPLGLQERVIMEEVTEEEEVMV